MTDKRKTGSGKKMPKVQNLAPRKGQPQELSESEQEAARGGMRKAGGDPTIPIREQLITEQLG